MHLGRSRYSRFPNKYVAYDWPAFAVKFLPTDENIRVRDNIVEVLSHNRLANEKLGWDSTAGWLAYLAKSNMLLVKRFAVSPDRTYGEMLGLTVSVFYYRDRLVELEPIGPLEELRQGESAAFTETWSLLDYDFPDAGTDVDLAELKATVKGLGTA